ncbi:MAG: hypothetical protein WCS01_08560, partial [bacterium]
ALVESQAYYVYWFVSQGHETPSSTDRIFYSMWDRVVHGRVSRWAYVSLTGDGTAGLSASERALQPFIRDLYPEIMVQEKK